MRYEIHFHPYLGTSSVSAITYSHVFETEICRKSFIPLMIMPRSLSLDTCHPLATFITQKHERMLGKLRQGSEVLKGTDDYFRFSFYLIFI